MTPVYGAVIAMAKLDPAVYSLSSSVTSDWIVGMSVVGSTETTAILRGFGAPNSWPG